MTERHAAALRLLVPLYSMINLTLLASGHDPLPFEEPAVDLAVTTVAGVVGTLIAWWKNNNLTRAAQQAQQQLKRIKKEKMENLHIAD